jgi:acyl-CoA synthetase (AMP-forming)/AMP-acid ligase II
MSEALAARCPTILVVLPSLMRLVAALPDAARLLGQVRGVYTVSEPLTRTDLAAWRAVLPRGARIAQSFGMTEANAIAGWFLPDDVSAFGELLPAGYPRSDYEIAVVDDAGAPVPAGAPGRLWVRGPMIAPGEWRAGGPVPGDAAPDPARPGWRIARTNDTVRLRADGLIEFAARADDMAKIRGNRVEPAEVEAAIRRVLGVADVVVLVRRGASDVSLSAHVAATEPITREAILAHLRAAIPAYMVPARIRTADSLPRLPNGKPDRTALARIDDAETSARGA